MTPDVLPVMKSAALAGGKELLKHFSPLSGISAVNKSSHADILTIADGASQEIIRQTLVSGMVDSGIPESDIGFIGEEKLHRPGKYMFIIDPLDGTTNYASGIDYFCVSVGFAINGNLSAGLIYDPIRNTVFSASAGRGAFMEKDSVTTSLKSTRTPFANSLVSYHLNLAGLDDILPPSKKLVPEFRSHRSLGSLALELCYMTTGVFTLVMNPSCYDWDLCAAKVLLNEVGLDIYMWDGSSYQPDFLDSEKQHKIFACRPRDKEFVLRQLSE